MLVLRTKSDDIAWTGYARRHSVNALRAYDTHVVLQPPYERQRLECARALELAWRQRAWCVCIDELFYLEHDLKLRPLVDRLLTQGRGPKISVVCGMQRPTGITRNAIAQAGHVICFTQEGRDAKIVAEATTPAMLAALEQVRPERYEFAYYRRKGRVLTIGSAATLDQLLLP